MAKRTLPMILAVLILMILIPMQAQAAGNEDAEYTVTLTSDIQDKLVPEENFLAVGETFRVQVMVSGNDASVYNAYDLKLTYDTENLIFLPEESEAADPTRAEITDNKGRIRVKGYGDDKDVSVPAATLVFETKARGVADVKFTTNQPLQIDISGNAGVDNAKRAATIQGKDAAELRIDGYKVITVGEGIKIPDGIAVSMPNDDFEFTLEETDIYTYELTVTSGGTDISDTVTYDETAKTYSIPWKDQDANQLITGKIVITANRSPKEFSVTIKGDDVTGEEKACYNTDYSFQLSRKSGYWYNVKVTIGGKSYTEFDVKEDTYTIRGAAITGDIVITVTKEEDDSDKVTVTFAGAGAKDGSGAKKTKLGVEYPFKVKQKKGYTYSVTVYVNGRKSPYDYDYELDTYYILDENVTGNIVIVIGKIATIEILEYITLEKQNMYLVVFNGHVNEGDVPKYDGRSMYWSERYNAYAWLLTSADTVKKVKTAAEKNITLNPGTPAGNIDYSGNVDMDLWVDAEDAELVWEMYQGQHSLDFMEMQKLLNADVYSDKKLSVRDVTAIVSQIS